MEKQGRVKFGLIFSFMMTSLFISGLPVFVMQAVTLYDVSKNSAGALETWQNMPQMLIALLAFSYIVKLGYRKTLIIIPALMFILLACMPFLNYYWALKVYLVLAGGSFVIIKMTVYSSVSLVTKNKKEHAAPKRQRRGGCQRWHRRE